MLLFFSYTLLRRDLHSHTEPRFFPAQSPAVIYSSQSLGTESLQERRLKGSSVFVMLRDILRRPIRCTTSVFVDPVTKDLYALLFLCLVSLRVPSLKVVSVCVCDLVWGWGCFWVVVCVCVCVLDCNLSYCFYKPFTCTLNIF